MAKVCGTCLTVHPPGAIGCEDAKRINKKNAKEFNRRVKHHEEHCRGCPDPAEHVRELDRLNHPEKGPIRYAKKIS